MLHILAVIFIISLLNPAFARANFFEEKDTPVQESGCSGCSKEIVTSVYSTPTFDSNKTFALGAKGVVAAD
jgi:hypothetical protein